MILPEQQALATLQPWLAQRRWFGAKGHRITGMLFTSRFPLPGVPGGWHTTLGVEIDGGPVQVYQVPLLMRTQPEPASLIGEVDGGHLHDGLQHAEVMSGMLAHAASLPKVNPAGGSDSPEVQWLRDAPPVSDYRLLDVEQSNTSAVFAGTLLVKVFRLLTAGSNPDIEVHEGLYEVGCHDVGRLWGWVNGGWTDPFSGRTVHGHLAMIQEFFAGSVDGWDLGRRYVAQGQDFRAEARELGAATARVHAGLAQAFPTAELGDAQIVAMGGRLHDRLAAAVEIVPALAPLASGLHARLDRLEDLGHIEVQRVHGDYHLGQVLRTSDGWKVLDFEGEPGGDVDSRRVLDHPMRDVAAMLRSFAYAAWQGAGNTPAAQQWQRDCSTAFLEGYAEQSGMETAAHAVLLSVYTVDKAAYEAVYEQRNRPDWVGIPLAALQELAAGG